MVEVFKTNVDCPEKAKKILELIHNNFFHYSANFDLEDCDRILRVESRSGSVENDSLIELLKKADCESSVLPG